MKIVWLPLSVARAAETAEYIAQDKPSSAEKWINTVFTKVEQLKSSSEMGRMVVDILTVASGNLYMGITELFIISPKNKFPFSRFDTVNKFYP